MTPSLLTFAFMSKLIDIPRSGNCYCNTKGVTGDHCEKCDTQNHYFGDPIKGRQPTNISPPKNVKSLQSAPFSPFSDQNLTHFWFSVNLIFQSRSLKTKQLTCLFIYFFFFFLSGERNIFGLTAGVLLLRSGHRLSVHFQSLQTGRQGKISAHSRQKKILFGGHNFGNFVIVAIQIKIGLIW